MASTVLAQLAFVLFLLSGSLGTHHKENLQYYIFNNAHYNEQLESSNYLELIDVSLSINVVIRVGCGNSSLWIDELIEIYVKEGRYNTILVDYEGFELSTVKEVEEIGFYIGEFLHEITSACGIKLTDVHVIGYSVGAHIAGYAGKRAQQLSALSLGRITALDAQLYPFIFVAEENRLSKSDAELVVAVHTNGNFKGFLEPIGHIDFYPNGGVIQPGCNDLIDDCSHERAPEYFVEAVSNSKGFVSKKCASYFLFELGACNNEAELSIGGSFTAECRGTYYLKTNGEKPYSKE